MLSYRFDIKEELDFKVAQSRGTVKFDPETKVDKDNSLNTFTYYPSVRFRIALYKDPLNIIVNAYFPMVVLALLTLSIFASEVDFNSRIANIAVVLLAYIAFIPTVRSILPPVPYLTLSDVLIGLNLAACSVLLLESYLIHTFRTRWSEQESDRATLILFIISAVLFAIPYATITVLYSLYVFRWQKTYASKRKLAKRMGDDHKGGEWYNPDIGSVADGSQIQILQDGIISTIKS